MEDFYNKEEYTIDDVMMLINDKVQESLKLEYKSSGAINADKKQDIGKYVSSFANSAGGIIVYGIREENQMPTELTYIDGTKYSRERLEHFISQSVTPTIEGIRIYPILVDNDLSKSIYVVKIPQSKRIHMNMDNRYYRRQNFQSVPMEEYEVMNMYLRNNLSDLEICYQMTYNRNHSTNKNTIIFRFYAENVGGSIERFYKMILSFPRALFANVEGKDILSAKYFAEQTKDCVLLAIPNNSPIFQNERSHVIDIVINVSHHDSRRFEHEIIANLYYSNGNKSETIPLIDKFEKLWN